MADDFSSRQLADALVQACSLGDLGALQTLLSQHPGIDVNIATEGTVTLLMHAIIGAGKSCLIHIVTHEMCWLYRVKLG